MSLRMRIGDKTRKRIFFVDSRYVLREIQAVASRDTCAIHNHWPTLWKPAARQVKGQRRATENENADPLKVGRRRGGESHANDNDTDSYSSWKL
jgi:hypothetical protein